MNVRRVALPLLLLAGFLVVLLPAPPGDAGGLARDWKQTAARIDRELLITWQRAGITPAPEADDAAFVRRVTLDLIGRVPTAGEAEAFLDDPSPDRRRRLVEKLLASDDYAEHWADVYSDLLFGREMRLRPKLMAPARQYLVEAFADNRPLDRMAIELLTATGTVEDDGAVTYLLARRYSGGSIEQAAGETARIFLGTRIQCAQCHDHPYDKTLKKADFAAFAAWFDDVRARHVPAGDGKKQPELWDHTRRRRKADAVTPTFLGRAVEVRDGETRRQALARALVGSDLFAKAIVNRTWGMLFGAPISAPWDDLGHENAPEHPRLLRVLAAELEAGGFDHERLLEAIVLSDAYQRASTGGTGKDLEGRFARAAVRPLGADAMFDSLMVASGLDEAGRGIALEKARANALREFLFVLDDDEMAEADAFTGSIAEALLLRNGRVTHNGARSARFLGLGQTLAATRDPGERLDWMFLAAYARRPTAAERERYLAYLEDRDDARVAYEDLWHALLSSTEFITNH